jgi:hypothetical protein
MVTAQSDHPRRQPMFRRSIISLFLVAFLSPVLMAAEFGATTQYFPQVAAGAGSVTNFSVHNPGVVAATVRLELRSSDGASFYDSTVTIPPAGSQTVSVGSGITALKVGWARLSATAGEFTAAESFQLTIGGEDLPRVGVLPMSPVGKLRFFGLVSGGANTGIAVANPSDTNTANISVRLLTTTGTVLMTSTTSLAPRTHSARFLSETPWFPGLVTFEGMVDVESTEPVILTMLRSDDSLLSAAPVITASTSTLTAGSVTTDYLADGAVTSPKLADHSVTNAKIADGAVGFGKLSADVNNYFGVINAAMLAMWEPNDGKTRLLFPFVSNQVGYDTGIVITNTGLDNLGTTGKSGTATVYYYNGAVGHLGSIAPQTTGTIAPGESTIFSLSSGGVPGATSSAANFRGYIIVICNFPFGHGHYVITDLAGDFGSWGGEAIVLPQTRDPNRVESRGH